MRSQSKTLVFPALLIRLLLATSLQMTSTMPAEVDDEREFDYIVGGERGPRKWGEIKEEWEACGKGQMQSPVDLSSERVRVITKTEDIERSYKPGNASVKNRGHDIRLRWDKESAGSIKINGMDYSLQQCHWHSPSEHTINGIRYALELHMVHTSSQPNTTNNTAVVGLFYKTGDPDAFLDELLGRIMSNITGGDKHEEREVGVIDPREIKMGGRSYFKYLGSLTVPPCTKDVVWIINKEISNVSTNQVKLLREAVDDDAEKNARPIQALNGRETYLNRPHRARTSI